MGQDIKTRRLFKSRHLDDYYASIGYMQAGQYTSCVSGCNRPLIA